MPRIGNISFASLWSKLIGKSRNKSAAEKKVATVGQKVIQDSQVGGHAGAIKPFKGSDGRARILKTTTKSEVDYYRKAPEELKKYLPKADDANYQVPDLQAPLRENQIVFANVTDGLTGNAKGEGKALLLDIKLGKSTYSSVVDQKRGRGKKFVKALKMKFADIITRRTYKNVAGKGILGRLKAAKATEQSLDSIFKEGKLHGKTSEVSLNEGQRRDVRDSIATSLEGLAQAMWDSNTAFFGESVTIVIGFNDKGTPEARVNLIDVGNHMTLSEAEADGPDCRASKEYTKLRKEAEQGIADLYQQITGKDMPRPQRGRSNI